MVASVGRITAGDRYRYLADEVATSRHDYYAGRGEAPGIWAGSGCDEFDLTGTVRHSDMDALFGRLVDPRTTGRNATEAPLGRRVTARVMHEGTPREHVAQPIAALDVTFSPSKSVSALWAAHPSDVVRATVTAAHNAAVAAGLNYLEASASHTRAGAGGLKRVDSTGFIVAKFRHRTARSTAPDEASATHSSTPTAPSSTASKDTTAFGERSTRKPSTDTFTPRGPLRSDAGARTHEPSQRRMVNTECRRTGPDA